jgi:hypothetical protein
MAAPAAALANDITKAAREAEIDASPTQLLTARRATNTPTDSRSETAPNRTFCAIRHGMEFGQPGT